MNNYSYRLSNWMEDLNEFIGDTDLRYVKIPATHNSGSFDEDTIHVKCQNKSIEKQLECGVRAFDIRLTNDAGEIRMHHNGYTNSKQSFKTAVEEIEKFLNSHKKEFVIINLSAQNGSSLNDNDYNSINEIILKLEHLILKNDKTKAGYFDFDLENKTYTDNYKYLKPTLNSIVVNDGVSTNQLMLISGLGKQLDPQNNNLYWGAKVTGTWEYYMSMTFSSSLKNNYNTVQKRYRSNIKTALNNRPKATRKCPFLYSDWYLYDIWQSTSTVAEQCHRDFMAFLHTASVKHIKNTNIVVHDFMDEKKCRKIINLNLEFDLRNYIGEITHDEEEPVAATVYEHYNYGGRSLPLLAGYYSYEQLCDKGFNDIISSVKLSDGCEISLYNDANCSDGLGFSDYRNKITSDTPNIGGFRNDKTSSIIVERTKPVRVIYGDMPMSNKMQSFTVIHSLDKRIEIFAIDKNNSLNHIWQTYPNGDWSNWTNRGGVLKGEIKAAYSADNRIELFVLDHLGRLNHIWQTSPNGGWSNWVNRGGNLTGEITVSRSADNRIELFALDKNGTVNHIWQTSPNGGWSNWVNRGGNLTGEITVSRSADNRIELFALDKNGAIAHIWQTSRNGGWSNWSNRGGNLTGRITANHSADNRIELFALDKNGALCHIWQTSPNGGWSNWSNRGGNLQGKIVTSKSADNRIEIFALDKNGSLNHIWQTSPNGGWSSWVNHGGSFTGEIAAVRSTDNRIELFVLDKSGAINHICQTAPNSGWSKWVRREAKLKSNLMAIRYANQTQQIFALAFDDRINHISALQN